MINKIKEPETFVQRIALALLDEGHLKVAVSAEGDKYVVSLTTVNRLYGKLAGGGGKTINSLNIMMKGIDPDIEVVLMPGDDTTPKNPLWDKRIRPETILEEYCELSPYMKGCVVDRAPGKDEIMVSGGEGIPPVIKCKIEIVIYAIGRTNKQRGQIVWI